MVVHQDESGEWKECAGQGPRSDYTDGCTHPRLGSSLQGCLHQGSVVAGRVKNHISYLELLAAMFAVKVLRTHPCPLAHGQQDISVLCKLHGRNPLPKNEQTSYPALAVVLEEEPVSITYLPRVDNCITEKKSVSRVKAALEDISTDSGKVLEVHSGSIDLLFLQLKYVS